MSYLDFSVYIPDGKEQRSPVVMKPCEWCGGYYQEKRRDQRFCSDECRYGEKNAMRGEEP